MVGRGCLGSALLLKDHGRGHGLDHPTLGKVRNAIHELLTAQLNGGLGTLADVLRPRFCNLEPQVVGPGIPGCRTWNPRLYDLEPQVTGPGTPGHRTW